MTKDLGSKMASSVRQAKTKQPQTEEASKSNGQKVPAPLKVELPLPLLPSRRIWPD